MDCETRLATPLQSTHYGQSESALIENLKILAVIRRNSSLTDLQALSSEASFKIVLQPLSQQVPRRSGIPPTSYFWREL
jgi:hypothetical protein